MSVKLSRRSGVFLAGPPSSKVFVIHLIRFFPPQQLSADLTVLFGTRAGELLSAARLAKKSEQRRSTAYRSSPTNF
jgi:hypothetical protein